MAHNPEEYCGLRKEFIEAAGKYEDAGYKTFIQRTARSEEGYYESGRYDCVALIKWPYRPWRKCWILAPLSGTNEEPFSTMKTLFSKAWLWLPRVIAERIVDTAERHLSPPADLGLHWVRSHYQLWCWLLWFDWLWRCGKVETEEPEVPPAGMDLSPFSSSADLIARWGLDGSAGTIPAWLVPPPDPESQTPKAQAAKEAGGLIDRLIAGPDDVELSPRELALLEAYLKQPVSLSQIQRETQAEDKSGTARRRNKLKLIRDFKRNLRAATPAENEAAPTNPVAQPRDATKSESAKEASLGSLTGFLGGATLADAMGIHATRRDAFFRQLERQRMSLGDDCWHEVREPRPNSPRFLYRVDSPKLRELATAYKTPKPA